MYDFVKTWKYLEEEYEGPAEASIALGLGKDDDETSASVQALIDSANEDSTLVASLREAQTLAIGILIGIQAEKDRPLNDSGKPKEI